MIYPAPDWKHYLDEAPPHDRKIELWRPEWAGPTKTTVAQIPALMNVRGLYWRLCSKEKQDVKAEITYCAEIEAAAEAMFVASSSNSESRQVWKEIRHFPAQALTVSHYIKLATAALESIDRVRGHS